MVWSQIFGFLPMFNEGLRGITKKERRKFVPKQRAQPGEEVVGTASRSLRRLVVLYIKLTVEKDKSESAALKVQLLILRALLDEVFPCEFPVLREKKNQKIETRRGWLVVCFSA